MKKNELKSAVFQYFRTHEEDWEDRIVKIKECGFNAIETIVPWNMHEPEQGQYCFTGRSDLERFIKLVDKHGLKLITRQSPYTCGEHEAGGIPHWVSSQVKVVRAFEPVFIKFVKEWYAKLCPILAKYTEDKGGPIIGTQIENEYGAFSYDSKYMNFLKDELFHYFPNLWIFTSDNPNEIFMKSGSLEGIHETLNFGSKPLENFELSKNWSHLTEPRVNMEYWGAWYNAWGGPNNKRDISTIIPDLKEMLDNNIGINYYMFAGGTNFAFQSGGNFETKEGQHQGAHNKRFLPLTTSIDYDSPISESGELTEKYYQIKELFTGSREISEHIEAKPQYLDVDNKKMTYLANIYDYIEANKYKESILPLSFRDLGQAHGYTIHQHEFEVNFDKQLSLNFADGVIRDRVHAFIENTFLGVINRNDGDKSLEVPKGYKEKSLTLIVENLGRANYGWNAEMIEEKGLVGALGFGQTQFFNWKTWTLSPSDLLDSFKTLRGSDYIDNVPSFYEVEVDIDEPEATFIEVSGSKKGLIFVNGNNLGRYWEVGPQISLYSPKHFFKKGKNIINVFETDPIGGKPMLVFHKNMKYIEEKPSE